MTANQPADGGADHGRPVRNQDEEHLRLLTIFHYVVGGLAGLFALFPIIHLVLGLFFILAPEKLGGNGPPPPAFVGWMFITIATVIIILGWVFAGLVLAAGRFLGQRRSYTFCMVVAAIECLLVPFGTALGVFTLIVLSRESVRQLFGVRSA